MQHEMNSSGYEKNVTVSIAKHLCLAVIVIVVNVNVCFAFYRW
jgi:hypothetical protein